MRGLGVSWAVLTSLATAPVTGQGDVQGVAYWDGAPVPDAVLALIPAGGAHEGGVTSPDTVDQRHLRFAPQVLAIEPGGSVAFVNSDPIMHNVFSPDRRGAGFDLGTYPRLESRTFTFAQAGSFVVLCHVHPEMAAWVVVVPTSLHAVTGPDGTFMIQGVPAGTYTVEVTRRGATALLAEPVIVSAGGVNNLRVTIDPTSPSRQR